MAYDGSQIEGLEGLEAVRQRPGMYLYDTGTKGLHQLIWEAVDNAVDESVAGYGTEVVVILHEGDAVTVIDNGRGIPCDIHPKKGIPTLDYVMTSLHAGGKFGSEAYKGKGYSGLHGVGISCVNAVSAVLEAEVKWGGRIYKRRFERGKVIGDENKIPSKPLKEESTGTTVRFEPDPEIFRRIKFDPDEVERRLRQLSYLCPNVSFKFHNERDNKKPIVFMSNNGLLDYMVYLTDGENSLFPEKPMHFKGENDDVDIEVVIQFCEDTDAVVSFANNIHTQDDGTHVTGFRSAFTRAANNYGRDKKIIPEKEDNLTGYDLKDGMISIVSVKLVDPIFSGQVKHRLSSPEVEKAVVDWLQAQIYDYFSRNNVVAKTIIENALAIRKAKKTAKEQAKLVRRKGPFGKTTLPGKLIDCSSKDSDLCEIFIAEGDSAVGTAKAARNSRFQAVFPLKGKPINAEHNTLDKILKNEEMRGIISALGCGIIGFDDDDDESFNLNKLRYKKIVIMTDADDDGRHIRCLLATFFFRFMRPIVENGYLYVADPPLYTITSKRGTKYYAITKEEMEKLAKKYPGCSVTRNKGLGEMDDDELKETVMNPDTRNLIQVDLQQVAEADKIVRILMGGNPASRLQYVIDHSDMVGKEELD